jgi:hypothetical protein
VKRRGLRPLALSAVLVLGAWFLAGRPPIWHEDDQPRDGLTELHGIDKLQARFNADAGMARLILILSPT